MKHWTKKTGAVLLALLLSMQLFGCGSTEETSQESKETEVTETEATETEATETEATEETETEEPESTEAEEEGEEVWNSGNPLAVPDIGAVIYQDDEMAILEADFYITSAAVKASFPVAFFAGLEDVAYVPVADGIDILNEMAGSVFNTAMQYNLTADEAEKTWTVTKDNGCELKLSWDDGSWVAVSDIDALPIMNDQAGDLVSLGNTSADDGSVYYIEHQAWDETLVKQGYALITDLENDYGMKMYYQNDQLYMPLSTFNDLFIGSGMNLLYNGQAVFLAGGSLDTEDTDENGLTLMDIYYAPEPGERSEALCEITYRELCFMLDITYGLKEQHGITNFNTYFKTTGLDNVLKDPDPELADAAISKLVYDYFADVHSTYMFNSAYTGADFYEAAEYTSDENCQVYKVYAYDAKLQGEREEAGLTEGGVILNAYEEVGDTAFITFDSFSTSSIEYYNYVTDDGLDLEALSEVYMTDTIGLVIYANAMIHREDSPVQNVVIDLLCNGGGQLDAAAYISSWILGEMDMRLRNQMTSAEYAFRYKADVNLDGAVTEEDCLDPDTLNVYCFISPSSFSCGNLLPSILKSDGRVTLIGQQSGGGGCAVYTTAAADGTVFNISSSYEFCMVKNGSYYSVDEGIEPDIYIRDLSKLFDRSWVDEYLKTIN